MSMNPFLSFRIHLLVAILLTGLFTGACDKRQTNGVSSTGTKGKTRSYTMEYFGKPNLPKVTVTAEIPGTWKETLSQRGAPSFTIPGKTGTPPTITAIGLEQPEVNARLEDAIRLQYGSNTADLTRTPFEDGRIWAVRKEGEMLHARMFIPAPHGVVMAVAIVKSKESDRLAEIEAVYQTVRVQTGQ